MLIFIDLQITNGEDTYIDEHPWLALIQYQKPSGEIGNDILYYNHKKKFANKFTFRTSMWRKSDQ